MVGIVGEYETAVQRADARQLRICSSLPGKVNFEVVHNIHIEVLAQPDVDSTFKRLAFVQSEKACWTPGIKGY
jgi:hypothetical protein